MSALAIASVVFICCFGAALVGMVLHIKLPEHHLDADSKDVVKLVMGLIATMAALVLGLLIASTKGSYDTQITEMQQIAANIVELDQTLALYGPETRETRDALKQAVIAAHQRIWPANDRPPEVLDASANWDQASAFFIALQNLSPQTEVQRRAQSTALQLSTSLRQIRTLMFEQLGSSISWPFLIVVIFWVSVLFLGFGLFARFHITVTTALIIGALSIASGIFLILELNQPYVGIIRISDMPIRSALAHIDR